MLRFSNGVKNDVETGNRLFTGSLISVHRSLPKRFWETGSAQLAAV